MRPNWGFIGMLAGVSLFIGIVIVAVGAGAIFPSMHRLTAPLLCSGRVEVESIRYSYKPGQVGWEHHIYCTGDDGSKSEITFPAIGVTGLVASGLIFIFAALRFTKDLFHPEGFAELATDLKHSRSLVSGKKESKSPMERLAALKKMRDENLISEADYDRKKGEILESL